MGTITFFFWEENVFIMVKKAYGKRFLLAVTLFLLFVYDMLITVYSRVKNKI